MASTARVALVTGGASGIGLAVVEYLVEQGWKVAILDLNLEAAITHRERLGGDNILVVQTNVVKYDEQADAFAKTFALWNRLDFVFANADQGFGDRVDFAAPVEELENGAPRIPDTLPISLCLIGATYSAYLALHYFRKSASRGGKIVMTSSIAALYSSGTNLLYSAAKAGIVSLTRSLGARLQGDTQSITVNCICPGLVATPLLSPTLLENVPASRFTPVSTIVRAVSVILESTSMTGQVLECSGENIYYRDQIAYSDENVEWIANGGVGELILKSRTEMRDSAVAIMKQ